MAIAKSGHLSTHQSQQLHSMGFTATGKPSSSSTSTFRGHNSIQILHRLHHLSNIWMVTLGYLLFFFLTLYLTLVFLDSTNTIPHLSYNMEWDMILTHIISNGQDEIDEFFPALSHRFTPLDITNKKTLQLYRQRASSF